MSKSPVVIFGYKRAAKLDTLLTSLEECTYINETDVFIFIDGPKSKHDEKQISESILVSKKTRNYKSINLVCKDINIGLANSIITGVTEVIEKYGRVIVLEDDLSVNKNFLLVMNDMLDEYKDHLDIWSINGYSFPIKVDSLSEDWYAVNRASSWGWATWLDRWLLIEWDMNKLIKSPSFNISKIQKEIPDTKMMIYNHKKGYINSWALRWTLNQNLHNKISLSPKYSLVQNHGFSSEGTHGSFRKDYNKNYSSNFIPLNNKYVLSERINNEFRKFCKPTFVNYVSFIFKKIGVYHNVRKIIRK